MARRVREQTKEYSLPDQVKVDTDEKERKYKRKKYREKVQEMGGNVIFADEWDKIDPGLKRGIGLKGGGRAKFKVGGAAKRGVSKILRKK
jgi:hypothetical protein